MAPVGVGSSSDSTGGYRLLGRYHVGVLQVKERHSEAGEDMEEREDGWKREKKTNLLLVAKREANFADGDLHETFVDVASQNNESVGLLG